MISITPNALFRYRISFIIATTISMLGILIGDYLHSGIPAHHLFANPDLPSVSNAWGALLIPALTTYLTGQMEKSVVIGGVVDGHKLMKALVSLLIAALYAVSMATAFTWGYSSVSSFLFMTLLILALIFPLYRAPYYLGFVLGLTFFFGAVLPTLIGGVVVVISVIANFGIHPLVARMLKGLARKNQ